jgi:hypothetical protein
MKKLIIFLILSIIVLSFVAYIYCGYFALYTKDFYYGFILLKKHSFDYTTFYINLDKEIFSLKKTDSVIKKNELFKKYPEIKKALIKAKIIK